MAVENLELQEQRSDRKELEETLVKLEKHKEKLIQQIKGTRQLCYEESQQVMMHSTAALAACALYFFSIHVMRSCMSGYLISLKTMVSLRDVDVNCGVLRGG